MNTLHRLFFVGEKSFLHRQLNKLLSRHRADLVEPMHKTICKCDKRRRLGWGRRVAQEPLIKFHEVGNHRQPRPQVSNFRVPFMLDLLDGSLTVGLGSSDLFVDKSFTLLQIAPDVAHRPPHPLGIENTSNGVLPTHARECIFSSSHDLSTPPVLQWNCNRPSTRDKSSGWKSVLRLVEMFMVFRSCWHSVQGLTWQAIDNGLATMPPHL